MTVITISRQYGSGGDEIAGRLCKILGYQQFDKSLITQAAAESGISEEEIYDYSEENHKVNTFLDRVFSRAALMNAVPMWDDAAGMYYAENSQLSEELMLTLVRKAILSAHTSGQMVILGRGSQVLLKDQANVLHIRIIAPIEDRIQRVKEELKQSKHSFEAKVEIRREAQDLIRQRDEASADYLKQYYQVDWADPGLYHAVLNTGRLSLERATKIIVDLVSEY
jgi:cytidylate kinase